MANFQTTAFQDHTKNGMKFLMACKYSILCSILLLILLLMSIGLTIGAKYNFNESNDISLLSDDSNTRRTVIASAIASAIVDLSQPSTSTGLQMSASCPIRPKSTPYTRPNPRYTPAQRAKYLWDYAWYKEDYYGCAKKWRNESTRIPGPSVVKSWKRSFLRTGSLESGKPPGRKSTVTQEQLNAIYELTGNGTVPTSCRKVARDPRVQLHWVTVVTMTSLSSAEDPPYLTVGTDVSAKYKGAFCEAKVTDVDKIVKLRVLFKGSTTAHLIDDDQVKPGSELKIGNQIEARHPTKPHNQFVQATITKITDFSRYTVIFDDGDYCVLRRSSLRLKSGKHFAESETLDRLPLTNPEHFGNPVKVEPGAVSHPSDTCTSVNSVANFDVSLSTTTTTTAAFSEGSNSSISGDTDTDRPVNDIIANKKLKCPHSDSNSSADTIGRNDSSASAPGTPNGNFPETKRRSVRGGRRRRDSVRDAPKETSDTATEDSDSGRINIETSDTKIASNIDFDSIEIGTRLRVEYGNDKLLKVYEAKVLKTDSLGGRPRYYVHYLGWNNRYDEWITRNRIVSIVSEESSKRRKGSLQKGVPIEQEHIPKTTVTPSQSTALSQPFTPVLAPPPPPPSPTAVTPIPLTSCSKDTNCADIDIKPNTSEEKVNDNEPCDKRKKETLCEQIQEHEERPKRRRTQVNPVKSIINAPAALSSEPPLPTKILSPEQTPPIPSISTPSHLSNQNSSTADATSSTQVSMELTLSDPKSPAVKDNISCSGPSSSSTRSPPSGKPPARQDQVASEESGSSSSSDSIVRNQWRSKDYQISSFCQPVDEQIVGDNVWPHHGYCGNDITIPSEQKYAEDDQVVSVYNGTFDHLMKQSSSFSSDNDTWWHFLLTKATYRTASLCTLQTWGYATKEEALLAAGDTALDANKCQRDIVRLISASANSGSASTQQHQWGEADLRDGNIYWTSNLDRCARQRGTQFCQAALRSSQWPTDNYDEQYFIRLGICLPVTCSSYIINNYELAITEDVFELARSQQLLKPPFDSTPYYVDNVFCPPSSDSSVRRQLTQSQVFVLLAIIVWLSHTIFVTWWRNSAITQSRDSKNQNETVDDTLILKKCFHKLKNTKFIEAFDLRNNLSKFCTVSGSNRLRNNSTGDRTITIDALRVVFATYLVWVHMFMTTSGMMSNTREFVNELDTIFTSVARAGPYVVSIFFVVSGFLVGRPHFTSRHSVSSTLLTFYRRYWRLVPLYVIVHTLVREITSSPQFTSFLNSPDTPFMDYGMASNSERRQCHSESWLVPFGLLGNLITPWSSCVLVGWHLSIDMFATITAPLFLYLMDRYKTKGVYITLFSVIASQWAFSIQWYMIDTFKIYHFLVSSNAISTRMHSERIMKPYTDVIARCGSFYAGLIVAYYIYNNSNKSVSNEQSPNEQELTSQRAKGPNEIVKWLRFLIPILTAGWVLFGETFIDTNQELLLKHYSKWIYSDLPYTLPAFYRGLSDLAWSLLVYQFVTSTAPIFLQRLFELRWWAIIAKLHFGMILLHYEVILHLLYNQPAALKFSHTMSTQLFVQSLLISYIISFLLHIFVEMPMNSLITAYIISPVERILKSDSKKYNDNRLKIN
ncbi:AT-rich interactive domain-containing protein 4A, partial [Fragariocoptes setiger]